MKPIPTAGSTYDSSSPTLTPSAIASFSMLSIEIFRRQDST